MSLTAANADEWLPAVAGSESILALAIAQVIIREGIVKNQISHDFDGKPIDAYAPEQVTAQTDIPVEKIIRITPPGLFEFPTRLFKKLTALVASTPWPIASGRAEAANSRAMRMILRLSSS